MLYRGFSNRCLAPARWAGVVRGTSQWSPSNAGCASPLPSPQLPGQVDPSPSTHPQCPSTRPRHPSGRGTAVSTAERSYQRGWSWVFVGPRPVLGEHHAATLVRSVGFFLRGKVEGLVLGAFFFKGLVGVACGDNQHTLPLGERPRSGRVPPRGG